MRGFHIFQGGTRFIKSRSIYFKANAYFMREFRILRGGTLYQEEHIIMGYTFFRGFIFFSRGGHLYFIFSWVLLYIEEGKGWQSIVLTQMSWLQTILCLFSIRNKIIIFISTMEFNIL